MVCPSYFRTNLMTSLRGADAALGAVIGAAGREPSPLGPDDIAAAVLAGLDRGDELILPDPAARAAYDLKLRDRAAYDAQMRHQAAPSCDGAVHAPTRAGPVRDEDAFDVEAVADWLREHAGEPWRDRLDGTPEVRQFPGGASNLTYLLR